MKTKKIKLSAPQRVIYPLAVLLPLSEKDGAVIDMGTPEERDQVFDKYFDEAYASLAFEIKEICKKNKHVEFFPLPAPNPFWYKFYHASFHSYERHLIIPMRIYCQPNVWSMHDELPVMACEIAYEILDEPKVTENTI